MNNIIEVRNLSFAYGERKVLCNVDIRIPAGKFTVVIGRNGSGKSTLLRLMAGLIPLQKGSVNIAGKALQGLTARERARQIGFLSQQHKAVFPFTVREVALTGRAAHVAWMPSRRDREIALEAIETTGIRHLENRIYTELSGGEQQLVMIARTLAQQPEVILLDEPGSHLDYNNQLHILKLCRQLVRKGMTVVAVLHDPNMAFGFGEHFVFVHNTKVVTADQKEASGHPALMDIFHGGLEQVSVSGRRFFIPDVK